MIYIYMFILITWLNIVFLTNLKPKVWFVGADLYDDVQNPLSKNLRHCHQSQFWWGIPPSFPLLYTPLIVHKRFCKKKKNNLWSKQLIKKVMKYFFTSNSWTYFPGTKFLAALLAGDAGTHDGGPGLADDSTVGGSVRHDAVQGHR